MLTPSGRPSAPIPSVLPNLFVPGAAKSATSTLHLLLSRHPDICMSSPRKEPHYFAAPNRSREDAAAYAELFPDPGARFRGESSTGYFVFPGVVDAIREMCDDPRFIIVLRNPCDRTWSHYTWLRGLGFEPRWLRRAVLSDRAEEPDYLNSWKGNFRYYSQQSDYGRQVGRFVEAFGRERVHVMTTESLRSDPVAALGGCFRFLGLDEPEIEPSTPVTNRSQVARRPFVHNLYGTLRHAPRSAALVARYPKIRDALRRPDRVERRLAGPGDGAGSVPQLAAADRAWLAKMLADTVAELRSTVGSEFSEWAGDFPLAPAGAADRPTVGR